MRLWDFEADVSSLIGHTLTEITVSPAEDELNLRSSDGSLFKFHHDQDCCEYVRIEDIAGDLNDLVGEPILQAEEVSSEGAPEPEHPDSYTWTFYKLATINGSVTIRWLGESNGYYSEGVNFAHIPAEQSA